MPYTAAALVLTVMIPLLGGCGQMGPLYMPPDDVAQGKPAQQADQDQPQPDAP